MKRSGAPCEFCDEISDHADWCITVNSRVYYAYQIVQEPRKISHSDLMHLRALGVAWDER